MRRRSIRTLVALGLVGVAVLLAAAGLRSFGAWAIAKAPNHDGASGVSAPADVARIVRAEVGAPTATIEAWILEPDAPVGTTLVLHGIGDQKRSMIGVGRELRARGQRAVLVDLRGHGASTGRWLSYGVRESQDLSELLDHLDALGMLVQPVGIYGPSYGGAVALQTAALDPRVTRVVSVSTFSSLRAVVPPYAAQVLPVVGSLLPDRFIDLVVDDAGELAGFSPDAADAVRATAGLSAQVLLIHGDRDQNIPVENAHRLRAACAPGVCELMILSGGTHASTLSSRVVLDRALDFLTDVGSPLRAAEPELLEQLVEHAEPPPRAAVLRL